MPETTVLAHSRDLARTYHAQAYDDPWEIVDDYQRVLEYMGSHPNVSSQHVASQLNLPRSRIRPWMNGSIPHPVRAIQTAEARDWLPLTEATATFDALNRLVVWGCSQGTLKSETFTPYFRVSSAAERNRIRGLLEHLEVTPVEERTDDTHRSAEIRVADHGAVLGRVLAILGVPLDDETRTTVPAYLDRVSDAARRTFARTYLQTRGEYWDFNSRWILSHANRPRSYRRALATFYAELGADVEVHDDTISIDTNFADTILAEQ